MKVGILPITETFALTIDPEGKATVTFRQARTKDNIELANLFSEQGRVFGPTEEIEVRQKWNFEVVKRKRVFLTLVGATDIEDEDGNALFKFAEGKNGPRLGMSEADFNRVWGELDPDLAEELHTFCMLANPQWNPVLQGE